MCRVRAGCRQTPAVRQLTSHREIFHLSLIHMGAVSAPGVMATGAARGCGISADIRRARRWGESKLSRSLEWSRINKQKIHLLKHGKLLPKSEGIVRLECDCVTYEKMALIFGSVSRTLECSAGPKSQNDKTRYTII